MFEIDPLLPVALTEQIVRRVGALVQQGRLRAGTKLPSIRQLAKKLGVSPNTVVTAYDQLIALGAIVAHASSGFFVAGSNLGAPLAVTRRPTASGPLDAAWLARSNLEIDAGWIAAGGEALPGSWLEDAGAGCLARKTVRELGEGMHAPCSMQGTSALREALALHLRFDGIFVDPNCLITTDCAVQAVDLICRAMLRPADLVLVEEPTTPLLVSRLLHHGVRLATVRRRPDGLDLDELASICRREPPVLVFTQSALHNPTGWNSSIVNLHRLLSLAEQYGFTIAEDDVYGNLSQKPAARVAQLGDMSHVVYYSSFAKVMGPLVRLGFVALRPALVDAFIRAKLHLVSECSVLTECAALGMLQSGKYRKHLERLRRHLGHARAGALCSLSAIGVRFDHGGDGLFLWGELPSGVDTESLTRRAFAERILLAPGGLFQAHAARGGAVSSRMRFNAAASGDPRLASFLHRSLAVDEPLFNACS
jgi:DNA-binding transcriptional MocR family regulator